MNRDEALEYTMDYVRWPKNDTAKSALPHPPTEWVWIIGRELEFPTLVHSVHDPITYSTWAEAVDLDLFSTSKQNKYQRTIKGATLDVYDVLAAWDVRNPAVQHAVKKLLQPGTRGHKDKLTDLREALASIERAIELETPQHG